MHILIKITNSQNIDRDMFITVHYVKYVETIFDKDPSDTLS